MFGIVSRRKLCDVIVTSQTVVTTCCLLLAMFGARGGSGQRCKLPKDWRGRYYQTDIGEMYVRETRITTKGSCIDQHGDYFLFHSRDSGCYQCLYIIRRNVNIIQYRESFCSSPGTLTAVCSLIDVKSTLNTLVKDPVQPVNCSPFTGDTGYVFNYNDQTYGFCAKGSSYAQPCVNNSSYILRFNHCVAMATHNARELRLECVASWKEDSELFFYARVHGLVGSTSEDKEYRCFKYEQQRGGGIHVSMSGDSTCRGLRTARDGPFLMEFEQDSLDWPTPSCQFPDWLGRVTWRDASGQWRYTVGQNGEIINAYRLTDTNLTERFLFRCIQPLDYYRLEEEFIFLSFSTHNCDSRYQCLKMRRRAQYVAEFYSGSFMERWSRGRCISDNDYDSAQIIIVDDSRRLVPCPMVGVYHVSALTGGCVYQLDVGCHNSTVIYVESAAVCTHHSSQAHFSQRFVSLECRHTWKSESGIVHLVTRDHDTNVLGCLHFKDEDGSLTLVKDDACNFKIDNLNAQFASFSILREESCPAGWSKSISTQQQHNIKLTTDRRTNDQRLTQHHLSDDDRFDPLRSIVPNTINNRPVPATSPSVYDPDNEDEDEFDQFDSAVSSSGDDRTFTRGRYGRRYDNANNMAGLNDPIDVSASGNSVKKLPRDNVQLSIRDNPKYNNERTAASVRSNGGKLDSVVVACLHSKFSLTLAFYYVWKLLWVL